MKKLAILICLVTFALLLCACDGGLVEELNSPASAYEPFAKESYYIAYTSNGDGTCFVSGIVVKEAGVDVKIPKKSPDGDTVTAVKAAFSAAAYPVELPHVLTEQQYDAIMDTMRENGAKEFDIAKALAYYMPCSEKSSQDKLEQYPLAAHSKIYILTDTVTDAEYQNIAERLEHYLAGQNLASKSVCDAQVLELCKQHLTEQQTLLMLQAMYPEKPESMKIPSSVPSEAVQLVNGATVDLEMYE
jgi:hypothetical protein